MGEIVPQILVYNSITNTLSDEKLDARAPFSLIEFLNYIGNLEKTSAELIALEHRLAAVVNQFKV